MCTQTRHGITEARMDSLYIRMHTYIDLTEAHANDAFSRIRGEWTDEQDAECFPNERIILRNFWVRYGACVSWCRSGYALFYALYLVVRTTFTGWVAGGKPSDPRGVRLPVHVCVRLFIYVFVHDFVTCQCDLSTYVCIHLHMIHTRM
jgi:hypothetical protein